MVALASTLIVAPRVLLLDEPCLGLASPLAVKSLATIRDLAEKSAVAVLVVEQRVRDVLEVAHRVYVLRNGRVSFSGAADSLHDEGRLREVYL
jgi:ABC-type branched-subunit amino acid transport system ATPase component